MEIPFGARGATGWAFGSMQVGGEIIVPGGADAEEMKEVTAMELKHNLTWRLGKLLDADHATV
jgi:hypothetical protein